MTSQRPRLGIQGPVVGWQDPWAGDASDEIMRTGTGVPLRSQDGWVPPEEFLDLLAQLGADFYVHHVVPTMHGQHEMVDDTHRAGLGLVLGNEYGNINGPYVDGSNRYEIPNDLVSKAADTGQLLGLLYDEPEHLQINAAQYRTDTFKPHFGVTDGLDSAASEETITRTIEERARELADLLTGRGANVPLVAEQVFPVMFHTLARAGMTPCPKVMKESYQPLQLATALGAALQYERDLWICADLWGPDIGPWFTRAPGFPGHSPSEYAAALRMAYLFAPTHLFTENVDCLARYTSTGFEQTEFGDEWVRFVREFVPAHPLQWSYQDANPTTVLIHSEESNFGRGTLPFGNRHRPAAEHSESVFEAWHLLSRGTLPSDGSCGHRASEAPFPRHRLNDIPRDEFPFPAGAPLAEVATRHHPLFHALHNVVVYDETVTATRLGHPELILAAGSRLPACTRQLLRQRADAGATVIIADWLAGQWSKCGHVGSGTWIVTHDFNEPETHAAAERYLGPSDVWIQRFGTHEVRMTPDPNEPTALEFEVIDAKG